MINIRVLEQLLATTQNPQLQDELTLLLESLRTVVDMLRRLGYQLSPPGIDNPIGLPGVLKDAIEQHQSRWLQPIEFTVSGCPVPLSPEVNLALLRIVREALANTAKHAAAARVTVQLCYASEATGIIRLVVCDDGKGAAVIEQQAGHRGIQTMHEFARSIDAYLHLTSAPGVGTRVEVSLQHAAGTMS